MNRDINSRADELQFGFGQDAVEESIQRAEDYILQSIPDEAQRWVSAAFELKRREQEANPPKF